jgi:cell division protein FtsL
MEPCLSVPTANAQLPLRLEPESQTADEKANSPVGKRNRIEPARPLGQIARCREDLKISMATAVNARARKIVRVKRSESERIDRGERRRRSFVVGLFALALIGVVLIHVWLRLQVVRVGYILSTISKLQGRLEQENRELKVELATLTSPERLEALARNRLGLVPPEKGQVIVLP